MQEERDICQSCNEEIDVEHLIVTECDEILCNACTAHHDCSVCFPSEHDSDSEYTPTATSYNGDGDDDSTESSEMVEEPSSEQESL